MAERHEARGRSAAYAKTTEARRPAGLEKDPAQDDHQQQANGKPENGDRIIASSTDRNPENLTAAMPPCVNAAPTNPPMSACEELVGVSPATRSENSTQWRRQRRCHHGLRHRLWINDTCADHLGHGRRHEGTGHIEPTGHEDGRRGTHDTGRDHGRNGIGAVAHPLKNRRARPRPQPPTRVRSVQP